MQHPTIPDVPIAPRRPRGDGTPSSATPSRHARPRPAHGALAGRTTAAILGLAMCAAIAASPTTRADQPPVAARSAVPRPGGVPSASAPDRPAQLDALLARLPAGAVESLLGRLAPATSGPARGTRIDRRRGERDAFSFYVAGPADARRHLVLFHTAFGLDDRMRALAERLGALGWRVWAIDLFDGRTTGSLVRGYFLLREANNDPVRTRARIAAALDWLGERTGRAGGAAGGVGDVPISIAVVGFSFGGRWAAEAVALRPAFFDAAVLVYPYPMEDVAALTGALVPPSPPAASGPGSASGPASAPPGDAAPTARSIGEESTPTNGDVAEVADDDAPARRPLRVLALFGADDEHVPIAAATAWVRDATTRGLLLEGRSYAGGHAFLEPDLDNHAPASARALWRDLLAFLVATTLAPDAP